jgi:hypothetical protein
MTEIEPRCSAFSQITRKQGNLRPNIHHIPLELEQR